MNCLAKHDKSIPMPPIIYSAIDTCGGKYHHPGRYEIEHEGRFIDARNGVIEVSMIWPELIPATLFHEWRHHWQRFNRLTKFPSWPWKSNPVDYESSIRNYFRIWHEFDALVFELRHEPNDVSEYWFGLLGVKI